jgi:hypothetical protein
LAEKISGLLNFFSLFFSRTDPAISVELGNKLSRHFVACEPFLRPMDGFTTSQAARKTLFRAVQAVCQLVHGFA